MCTSAHGNYNKAGGMTKTLWKHALPTVFGARNYNYCYCHPADGVLDSNYVFFFLLIYLFIYLFTYLFIYLFMYLFIYLFIFYPMALLCVQNSFQK